MRASTNPYGWMCPPTAWWCCWGREGTLSVCSSNCPQLRTATPSFIPSDHNDHHNAAANNNNNNNTDSNCNCNLNELCDAATLRHYDTTTLRSPTTTTTTTTTTTNPNKQQRTNNNEQQRTTTEPTDRNHQHIDRSITDGQSSVSNCGWLTDHRPTDRPTAALATHSPTHSLATHSSQQQPTD